MELLILAIVTIVMMAIGVPIGISIAAGLISKALLFDTTTLTFIAQQLYTGWSMWRKSSWDTRRAAFALSPW